MMSKKTKKIVSAAIAILLVLAMVASIAMSFRI